MPPADMDVLHRLADDLKLAAWLLPADDELRSHLQLLGPLVRPLGRRSDRLVTR